MDLMTLTGQSLADGNEIQDENSDEVATSSVIH